MGTESAYYASGESDDSMSFVFYFLDSLMCLSEMEEQVSGLDNISPSDVYAYN